MTNGYLHQFKKKWTSPTPAIKFSDVFSTGSELLLVFTIFYFAVFSFNVPRELTTHGFIEFTIVASSLFCSWALLCAMAEGYRKLFKKDPFSTMGHSILKFLILYSLIIGILCLVKPVIYELEEGWIWPYYWRHFPYAFLIFSVYFYRENKNSVLKGLIKQLNQQLETTRVEDSKNHDDIQAFPLHLRTDGQTRKMHPSQISHISVNGHYLDIFHQDEGEPETLFVRKSLTAILKELSTPPFLRIHRSHIVNLNHILKIQKQKRRYSVILRNTQFSIPVSRSNLQNLLFHLEQKH